MPLVLAEVIVSVFEAYLTLGIVFAAMFLTRGIESFDPRVVGAPKTLRLLILPGTAAFWPWFLWRWIAR